jgi:glycosyltransferase involved in cell wall biosynthesis
MEAAGVQTKAMNLLRAMRAERADAEMVFLYKKRPAFPEGDGVRCLIDHRPNGLADWVLLLWRLIAAIVSRRPNCIVGFGHYASPAAGVLGAMLGVRRRIATQESPPHSLGKVARLLDLVAGTCGFYTANVAASRHIEECFRSYPATYRRRVRVVTNGVLFRPSTCTKRQARDRFGLAQSGPLLVTCGRLSHEKNHAFLLDLVEQLPGVHLAILGEGELRQALEQRIIQRGLAERVHLLGEFAHEFVPHFLRSGDVFVFPSLYEAFGLAVVEAMLAGVPVVCSDHPALAAVVGSAGELIPLSDLPGWVAGVRKLLEDEQAATDAASAGRARGAVFTFESMLQGFRRLCFAEST